MEREGLCVWRSKALCIWTENWKTGRQGAIFWGICTHTVSFYWFNLHLDMKERCKLRTQKLYKMRASRITSIDWTFFDCYKKRWFNGILSFIVLLSCCCYYLIIHLNMKGSVSLNSTAQTCRLLFTTSHWPFRSLLVVKRLTQRPFVPVQKEKC